MAILSNGKFYGFLCSAKETGQKLANGVKEYVEDFVSGFAGHGWKIWEYVSGKWMMEVDALRVRGQFTVFELLVSKIRAIIGAQAITQGCGKIKTVEMSEDGSAYLITVEEEDMSFVEHDFIRCQEFSAGQKMYHVEIESVTDGVIRIPKSEFETDGEGMVTNPPEPGDDIVQFGNSSHDEKYVGRHSAIYMHADESAQPAIDVLDGIYSKDWSNCLKVRMGGDIPGSDGLKGFYCVNGMIKGVDKGGAVLYQFNPDGSGFLGKGAIKWDTNGFRFGPGVKLTWDNLDDDTKDKLKGTSLYVQYSVDGISYWHDRFTAGDIYMRQKLGDGSWSEAMQIVGENGAEGAYMDFQFTVGSSSVTAPTSGWQDAPPDVDPGKYLWMRSGWVTPPSTVPDSWKTVRIQGNDGNDGSYTELRYKRAFSRPSTPAGLNPAGWAISPDSFAADFSHFGDFTKEDEYYVSPSSTSHSTTYKDRVSFVTRKNNQVLYMEVSVSSETYDYGIVCALDTTYSAAAETLWKKSGIESAVVEIVIPTAGDHFIDVVYVKDSSESRNEDRFKFRFVDPQICWLSTAVIGPNTKSPEWSEPVLFPTDTPDNEQIYLLAKSEIAADMPASDVYANEYIGDAPDYDNSKSYVVGNIVKYGNVYKVNISSSTSIAPDNGDHWQDINWWSDDPKGVSAEYPYEYTCNRDFASGKWGEYKNYHLFMHYGKDGEPGKDASRLPWIEEWNGFATEIDGGYIVTPKLFSGRRSEEGKLTGIAQGRECLIDADGNKRNGIFALVDDKIVFEMDPENGKYKFKGRIESDEIIINDFTKLSSAVFCGDYMYSQTGIDAAGEISNQFDLFDPDALGKPDAPFTPNILFDFNKGSGHLGGGKIVFNSDGNIELNSVSINNSIASGASHYTGDSLPFYLNVTSQYVISTLTSSTGGYTYLNVPLKQYGGKLDLKLNQAIDITIINMSSPVLSIGIQDYRSSSLKGKFKCFASATWSGKWPVGSVVNEADTITVPQYFPVELIFIPERIFMTRYEGTWLIKNSSAYQLYYHPHAHDYLQYDLVPVNANQMQTIS